MIGNLSSQLSTGQCKFDSLLQSIIPFQSSTGVSPCKLDSSLRGPFMQTWPGAVFGKHTELFCAVQGKCCGCAIASVTFQQHARPISRVRNSRLHIFSFFFIWMLHGSTKVVVRAVALLSAKTIDKVANSLKKCFRESNNSETNKEQTPTTLQSPRKCRGGWVWPVPRTVRSRASWQRREHACQPSEGEGNVCSRGGKMLQSLKLDHERELRFATCMLSRFNLVKIGLEHM